MKIQPTSAYIKETVSQSGQAVLLLGVRRDESTNRARSIDRYTPADGSRLNPHNDLRGCLVFRPIADFLTEEVWALLLQRPPPWGGSHRELWTLYRNAQGGECPLVIDADTAPSCGSSSSRFGCWTCTVVEKDRSSEGFVDAGFEFLQPLMDYRDWLVSIRNDPTRRMVERRTGKVQFMKDGSLIPGPFTLSARQEMLEKLLALEQELEEELSRDPNLPLVLPLITPEEREIIQQIWVEDAAAVLSRSSFKNSREGAEGIEV